MDHARHTTAPAGVKLPFSAQSYDGKELRPFEGRKGAMDAFRLPSRTGAGLVPPRGVRS
jgi:hypothetical protein